MMFDVSMIGLGAMGTALARAFLQAGHDTAIWNRSAEKMVPFHNSTAHCASSFTEAIENSATVVFCIDSYTSTKQLLEDSDADLSNIKIIQLTTGTPKESSELDTWVRNNGGQYIDGAIMPYPEGIGKTDARLIFAGPEHVYEECLPVLNCLGGDIRFLGENIVAAAVLDMALLTREVCGHLATVHGALICESENISIDALSSMLEDEHPDKHLASTIQSGNYQDPGATIAVWENALQRIQSQASHRKINREVPDLISSLFNRAIDSGFEDEDFAAIIKVMRRDFSIT